MMIKGKVERTGFALMVVMAFVLQGSMSFAGEESKLSQFLYRYDALKANTTTLLGALRRARLDGHLTNDRRPLLHLHKDVMDFCFEVRKYLYTQRTSGLAKPVTLDDRANTLAIAYSCEAMEQVLEAEFDVHQNGGQNPDLLLRIQEKYEEVWEVADGLLSASPETPIAERK
ncbi:hypothetical protein ACO9S2_04920 [Nitrospira sp. NS4]|uniref:hypothetical protein n=1 Tax=Nitrospira sp. NS4 TaxID=3414498 RepID=UPI003C2AFBE2